MDKRKRERSATIVIFKAILDLYGKDYFSKTKIKFSTGNGVYFETEYDISDKMIIDISNYLKKAIYEDLPINRRLIKKEEAIKLFNEIGYKDRTNLLYYKKEEYLYIHDFEDYPDYFYGSLAKTTADIGEFIIEKYKNGFVLVIPDISTQGFPKFIANDKIFEKLSEDDAYLNSLGIGDAAGINEFLIKQKTNELIFIQEAYIEKKITELANEILKNKNIRFIMIAGPSSSGKTTFAKKLSIHLKANGRNAYAIEVDNYFKDRKDTPKLADGSYDFETIKALDIEKFNDDMLRLVNGEAIELPRFDFTTGKRQYDGNFLKLEENDILVIEGIHCLNDEMSFKLDRNLKFKIYISALSSLRIDSHNRIATTDLRLIRRMVRDARTRGASASATIKMWDNVRRGEEKYIFPYQDSVDIVFNSALCYELPVLKTYVEPLLFSVKRDSEEYELAKRLIRFLDYFLTIPSDIIPNNSIIKEFIGGTCFNI